MLDTGPPTRARSGFLLCSFVLLISVSTGSADDGPAARAMALSCRLHKATAGIYAAI